MHWFGLVWISALTNLYIQAFSRFTKKNNKKQTDFTKAEASFNNLEKKRHHMEQMTPALKSHLWAKNVLIIHFSLLQLNGVDLTSVTAEQAMLELCKPTETVQILAQYNPTSE